MAARRATIELDEQLLAMAKRVLGQSTTRATVEEALRRVVDGARVQAEDCVERQRQFCCPCRSTSTSTSCPRTRCGVAGWLLDKGAAARVSDPVVGRQLADLAGLLFLCPVGELEQLYSARSAADYDRLKAELHGADFEQIAEVRPLTVRRLS